ncbi:MAG: hypothetical protein IT349_15690 [Candidatus Eisenbacteria bacterium]|nr:hypothetical protein [Candidatus Eisenbacteria bacterium]MCC7143541.1 hypothetical protein [Candidatus Eisenbacteria bacterium]
MKLTMVTQTLKLVVLGLTLSLVASGCGSSSVTGPDGGGSGAAQVDAIDRAAGAPGDQGMGKRPPMGDRELPEVR